MAQSRRKSASCPWRRAAAKWGRGVGKIWTKNCGAASTDCPRKSFGRSFAAFCAAAKRHGYLNDTCAAALTLTGELPHRKPAGASSSRRQFGIDDAAPVLNHSFKTRRARRVFDELFDVFIAATSSSSSRNRGTCRRAIFALSSPADARPCLRRPSTRRCRRRGAARSRKGFRRR